MDKFFKSTRWLRGDTRWHEFLGLRYIMTWRTHLYILLHERVLMVLKLIFHSLRAALILSCVTSYLLWPNNCLYTTFSYCGCWSLIINSSHILIGRTISSRYLLVLKHLLLLGVSLLPLVATLLLHVHLHGGVVVRVIWIEVWLNKAIARLYVSARASSWENSPVTWRCSITIAVSGSANAKVCIFHIHSLKSSVFFSLQISPFIIQLINIWWFLFMRIHFVVEL